MIRKTFSKNRYPRGLASSLVRGVAGLGVVALLVAAAPVEARQYAAIIVDAESGAVLHAENAELRNIPASLTKMMTLYLTFEAIRTGRLTLDTKIPVSRHAAEQPPTKLNLRSGSSIRVEDAILAAVTKSANDATTVLAEAVGGTEWAFARKMTEKASTLGMTRTQFRNSTGLPDAQQVTTARDMVILAQALYSHFPERSHYFSTTEFRWGKNRYHNHNRLLGTYRGVDGIKTGYTNASGFNLVTSVRRDGRHIYAVVMGGQTSYSRDQQMRKLLDRTFAKITPNGASAPLRVASASLPKGAGVKSAVVPVRPPKKPDVAKTATSAKQWGVQVGTFQARSRAHERARQATLVAPSLLKPATVSIQKVTQPTRTLYRAVLLGLTEKTARRTCQILESKNFQCLPVPPSRSLAMLETTATR
ncbi:MAG: D-alanyl-D-alanine carboxypeptidase family protein [Alphaproteobacteria bacterium]|nr:D-alanyl-D-alanine carboxypeptidase family protein [Alphaproteobacteria bacterium]